MAKRLYLITDSLLTNINGRRVTQEMRDDGVLLEKDEARWYLANDQLRDITGGAPNPGETDPDIIATDEVLMRRDNRFRYVKVPKLEAFLLQSGRPIALAIAAVDAPDEETPAPVTLSPLSAALIFG